MRHLLAFFAAKQQALEEAVASASFVELKFLLSKLPSQVEQLFGDAIAHVDEEGAGPLSAAAGGRHADLRRKLGIFEIMDTQVVVVDESFHISLMISKN